MRNKIELLGEWLRKRKKEDYIVMALLGMLLLIVAIPTEKKSGSDTEDVDQSLENRTQGLHGEIEWEYGEYWEGRLERVLSQMDGVGRVRVMISLQDSGEQIVEKDVPVTKSTTREVDSEGGSREISQYSSEESTLMVTKEDGTLVPYVIRENTPKVTGILVLAEGGDRDEIKQQIIYMLQALFDVEVHKIVVAKMKTG